MLVVNKTMGTNFNEILFKIWKFLYKNMKCSLQNGGQFDSASMTPWQSKYALQSIEM